MADYQPSQELLDKYADVLIRCALHRGEGLKKGEVVLIQVPECAKPMLVALRRSVLKAGGMAIVQYLPDDMAREYYELGSDEQLSFFPEKYMRGIVDQVDHYVHIIADTDKHELKGIDPKKIMMRQQSFAPYIKWRQEKENQGKLFWTLGMYATQQMADEVNLSLKDYWQQIIDACYLEDEDPVATWRGIFATIDDTREKLNALDVDYLHVEAEGTDLKIGLDKNRQWLGGSGHNIPSFEIFTSPDWRRTEGTITFTEPLYRYGSLIEGVKLTFKDGLVVESSAERGEDLLKEMIATKNADKVGEYSLTDGRLSKITQYMGETLYDENVGGPQGNTHLALGSAYKEAFTGDRSAVSEEEWEAMGYNDSVIHTDIVATSRRTVTAYLRDGTTKVIYKDGKFEV